jgi:uncharacterized protein YmfQ (DUF2313 family)
MSRTVDQVAASLAAVRPGGFAMPAEPDSYTAAFDRGPAEELALLEASAEAMLPEIDPLEAFNLLRDYERVLGPDPCGRDLLALTEAERRGLASQRWTAAPTVCAGHFIAAAAVLGITITVEEFPLTSCGDLVCGDDIEMNPSPGHLEFLVTLPATNAWDAICGEATCGDAMGGFTGNLMECVIGRETPLHALAHFNYTG